MVDFSPLSASGLSVGYFTPDPVSNAASPFLQTNGEPWRRNLTVGEAEARKYPMPPANEPRLRDSAGNVLTPPPAETILALHRAIASLPPENGAMEAFGRYLFSVLLGPDLWRDLMARAGKDEPIELGVVLDCNEPHLQKLPWEMAHSGRKFLAQIPGLSFVRRIKGGTKPAERKLAKPPLVLFCVGTDLEDEVIRPGAEYLGLLRNLKVSGNMMRLRTHLIQKVSVGRLEAAVNYYKPDVVHFICHGEHNKDGKPYLKLIDDDFPGEPATVYADSLVQALRSAGSLPPIVVLGACRTAESAQPESGPATASLAALLVSNGVPMVVGMSGRVSDQACRLFSRKFYEALLDGTDIASATSQGRLAALCGNSLDPVTSPDWTLPALFTSHDGNWSGLQMDPDPRAQAWYEVATRDVPGPFPAFCDRIDAMEKLDYVMASQALQRKLDPKRSDALVLAVSVDVSDDNSQSHGKLGRTWLLREMAGKAIRDGHVACLVGSSTPADEMPKDFEQLLSLLNGVIFHTQGSFGLPKVGLSRVLKLVELQDSDSVPADMDADIRNLAFGGSPRAPKVLSAALRLDLQQLLDEAAVLRPAVFDPTCRLLLLVDDLHRMGVHAVRSFLDEVVGAMRVPHPPFRVVFSYSTVPADGQSSTVKVIEDWFGKVNNVVRHRLGCFPAPAEELMAYQHFLLNWQDEQDVSRPLCVVDGKLKPKLFSQFCKKVQGVPSRLLREGSDVVTTFLDISEEVPVLTAADDDRILEESLRLKRNGSEDGG